MIYIQRRSSTLETVDEFETRKEALAMLKEYRLADRSATYYLSTRPCKAWSILKELKNGTFSIYTNQHRTRRVPTP